MNCPSPPCARDRGACARSRAASAGPWTAGRAFRGAAQNCLFCVGQPMDTGDQLTNQNGGSRATSATGNRHAARLMLQRAGSPCRFRAAAERYNSVVGCAQIAQLWHGLAPGFLAFHSPAEAFLTVNMAPGNVAKRRTKRKTANCACGCTQQASRRPSKFWSSCPADSQSHRLASRL